MIPDFFPFLINEAPLYDYDVASYRILLPLRPQMDIHDTHPMDQETPPVKRYYVVEEISTRTATQRPTQRAKKDHKESVVSVFGFHHFDSAALLGPTQGSWPFHLSWYISGSFLTWLLFRSHALCVIMLLKVWCFFLVEHC